MLQVVMSPHVYPPSVTKSTFLGDTLWQQCAIAFGYLENKGYCKWPGNCRRFPVIIGETGSFLHDWSDQQWMQVQLVPASCTVGQGPIPAADSSACFAVPRPCVFLAFAGLCCLCGRPGWGKGLHIGTHGWMALVSHRAYLQ